jgi:ATP-binding cassette, subfamily C, type I secretion system permease/ATPase
MFGWVASSRSELRQALAKFRVSFGWLALFSLIINVLMLTGAIFMLEVYDRVLPSGNIPTLVALAGLAVFLFAFQAALDIVRVRILARISIGFEQALHSRLFLSLLHRNASRPESGTLPWHDLDRLRSFIAGGGLLSLFDLPWIPVYLSVCFALHFWIGITASLGAIVLFCLTVATESLARFPTRLMSEVMVTRDSLAEAVRRNAETVKSMAMTSHLMSRWAAFSTRHLDAQRQVNDVVGGLGAVSKVLRMMLQSTVLAVGAYLVIVGEATAGIIIAGSILSARALAPIELAIAHWRSFLAARQGAKRLDRILEELPVQSLPLPLPRPKSQLSLEEVSIAPPGGTTRVLRDVSFTLNCGGALGIIGPSASGKSSLARGIVGVWPASSGSIRLDGASLQLWSPEALGASIGYVPQNVELFAGTIAENIARFSRNAASSDIISAAKAAQIHEMILRMPQGYETLVGDAGAVLSAGQRQRVALARALYGDPFLIVLDEPNSNLDLEGERALADAVASIKSRSGIAIIISHRPTVLNAVDHLLVLSDGQVQAFGRKQDVLERIRKSANIAMLGKK